MLAIGVAIGFAGALLLAASPVTDTVTEAGVQLLSVLGGGMIAVVAGYVSRTGHLGRDDDGRSDDAVRPARAVLEPHSASEAGSVNPGTG